MAVRESRSWTIRGDDEAIDAVIDDFARRRGLRAQRAGRRRIDLGRGSHERMKRRGAKLTQEDNLPFTGTLALTRGREETVRLKASLKSHRVGALMLRRRVQRRYRQLFGELLNDLEQSFGGGPAL